MLHGVFRTAASLAIAVIGFLAAAAAAGAQTPPASSGGPRWEVEFHGGFGRTTGSSTGSGQIPPAGQTFAMTNGVSSRYVPSWFFGDGAALLNAHNSSRSIAGRVIPLDGVLTANPTVMGGTWAAGVSVTRHVTPRWAIEGRVDMMPEAIVFTDTAVDQLVQTATSFRAAMNGVMGFWSFNDYSSVTSVSLSTGRQISAGAGVRLNLSGARSGLRSFLFVGGGWTGQSEATALLVGDYEFLTTGLQPIHETDAVTITARADAGVFGRAAFGITQTLPWHLGLRGEVSVTAGSHGSHTFVSTTPSRTLSILPDSIASSVGASNGIQFSSLPGTPSSLSLTLDEIPTFQGNGTYFRMAVDVGIFVRF